MRKEMHWQRISCQVIFGDFSDLIGQEQKFVFWAFTLESTQPKDNALQNAYMTIVFVSFQQV
jgi:hypothetical protein